MRDITTRLIGLLTRYAAQPMGQATGFQPASSLAALGLDELDLPILFLDIEDEFAIQLSEPASGAEMTLGDLVGCVEVAVKDGQGKSRRSAVPVSTKPWMAAKAPSAGSAELQ